MVVYWCTEHNDKCRTVPHSMPLSQVCSVYITFRCIYLYGWNLKNIISLTVRFPSIKLSAISRCKQFTWTDMWYIWLYLYGTKTTKLFIPMTTSTVLCQPKVFSILPTKKLKALQNWSCAIVCENLSKSQVKVLHNTHGCIDTWYIWHLGKIRQLNSPTAVPHETINLYREKFIEQFVPITTRHSHLNPVPLIKGKHS